ncbi:MAG: CRISPR-associated endonuclease Cas2 [Desulfitobacteriaceae bacterium]
MRVIVFFDLPMESTQERREYGRFRKYLLKSGFLKLQKSVYSKLMLNATASSAIMENVRKNKPAAGLVQMLTITEKQFARMEFVLGQSTSNQLDSTERLVVL